MPNNKLLYAFFFCELNYPCRKQACFELSAKSFAFVTSTWRLIPKKTTVYKHNRTGGRSLIGCAV